MSATAGARGAARGVYPHFDDLRLQININTTKYASIKKWVEECQMHLNQAQFEHRLKRADRAYINYMIAAEIVTTVIPSQKEFPTFKARGGQPYKDYLALQKRIEGLFPQIGLLRDEIKENNQTNNTESKSQQARQEHHIPLQSNGVAAGGPSSAAAAPSVKKQPPPVPAKPQGFRLSTDGRPNGSAIESSLQRQTCPETHNQAAVQDLSARFNRLRSNGGTSTQPAATSQATSGSQPNGLPASRGRTQTLKERPISPRLDTAILNGLPRPPSPTYSPARNSISPPRSIPRKPAPRPSPSTSTLNLTNETILSPAALSSYLSRGAELSLLVLDVRERTEFEEGHIPSKSIVCVEPLMLRENISGDELEESYEISISSSEHGLFSKRHQFDLVVYYDQKTPSDSFLSERTNKEPFIYLQRLHRALCQYSFTKPLKRPPVLLAGGLDAWVNMFGQSSLKTGETSFGSAIKQRSINSPTIGLAISTNTSSTSAAKSDNKSHTGSYKRKDSDGVPIIDLDEERAWLVQLRKDREPLTISLPQDAGNMDLKRQRRSTSIVSASDTYPRTIEQFFQQFPASPSVQQSMMTPIPSTPASLATPITPGFSAKRNTIIDHPFYGFTDVRNPEFHPPSPVRPPPAVPRRSYKGESEKPPFRPIESPLRPRGSPRPTLTIFPGKTMNMNFGTTGLKNLGNTCYMNSILQCMNGTIPLSRYFLDGSYKLHINKDNVLGSRGVLAEAFANVVKHLWDGQYKFISPMTFKDVSGRLNDLFKTNDQQDAQEFLEFLLDGLHEDLNPYATRTKLRELTSDEEKYRESLPVPYASYLEWQRYIHRNFSVIVNWFQGQLSSRLTCMTCNTKSTTYNPFMYLSLPIPPGKKPTIRDCLEEFCREEILEKEDAWHCPNCKKPRKATKKLTITRLPHMLIIHLKRFTNKGLWRDKLNTPISYPLKELDLSKYVPQFDNASVPPDFVPPPEQTAPFLYDLYGVCNHYGTLNGGHYTAFVRNSYNEAWNLFDDSKASRIAEEEVVSKNAYVLFWVRSHIM
ncbi:hypothetical protein BDZ91DRAFT_702920 [Kalaharituber pfeilii]|nr:hypothetical protein BDZ91DRAFT_702920 [Kalaharituber pfeilii]